MNSVTVSALWYTLIKGTAGIWKTQDGDSLPVGDRGIAFDRQWLVVDETGMFVAQRRGSVTMPMVGQLNLPSAIGAGVEVRSMCQVAPSIQGAELTVIAPNMKPLHLPALGVSGPEEQVVVWRDRHLLAVDQGREASAWFTEFLSRERAGTYRFMRMSDRCRRPSKNGDATMGFHDGFPFLVISDESLANLNDLLRAKGESVVPADRFRSNVWLCGGEPHDEDHFSRIRIGEVVLEGGPLCDRCVVTCTNQQTAERTHEPLATLAEYRRGREVGVEEKPNAVFFGRNFDHLNTGSIRIGDVVEILRLD